MSDIHAPLRTSELLAHVDGLRRLARRLVRDDAGADDLVQDTLVAAMRSGPPTGVAARPWLFGVLKNVRRHDARSASRRTARETAAARPEAVAPDLDAVTRAETHRRLVDEVIRLDEPYRTTLILRFFDGLDVAEIAARRQTPAATVRVHVHRGLAILRERLDERGGREAWVGAFVAAFGVPDEVAPTGAAPTTAGALGAKTFAAAAGLAVVGAVVWAWPKADVGPVVAAAPPPVAAPAPKPDRRRAESPPPETTSAPSVAAATTPLDDSAVRAQAAVALDEILTLQLGVASKADCLALVDSWAKRGPFFVPVLARLLDPSVAVGPRSERELIDALALLAVSKIAGDDGVRALLVARSDEPRSEARRTWLGRTATADELAALISKFGSFSTDAVFRGTGELSAEAREAVRKSGDLPFLARHGDANAVERLAAWWAENEATGRPATMLASAMASLPAERLVRLCVALPTTDRKGNMDPATGPLEALAASPPREESDVLSLAAWAEPMSKERRDAVSAVVLASQLAKGDGTPPPLASFAAHFGGDQRRAVDAAEKLPPDAAFVCLAHWAAAERAAGVEDGPACAAFGRSLKDRVAVMTETPPRASVFYDAPPDARTVAALRAVPWAASDLRSQMMAAGVEVELTTRGVAALSTAGATARDVVNEVDGLVRSGEDARIAQSVRSTLEARDDGRGAIATALDRPDMKTKASGPAVKAALRGAAASGRDAALRMHAVFLRVALEHPDESAAGDAALLAVRTCTTADQLEDSVRRIVATGRKKPIEKAFKGVAATGRILRDLTPERLGALVVAAVDAPIPDKVMEEILDEVEDAEEGRDADFRAQFVAVLEKCAPRSAKGREDLKKALDDFRKPPRPN